MIVESSDIRVLDAVRRGVVIVPHLHLAKSARQHRSTLARTGYAGSLRTRRRLLVPMSGSLTSTRRVDARRPGAEALLGRGPVQWPGP